MKRQLKTNCWKCNASYWWPKCQTMSREFALPQRGGGGTLTWFHILQHKLWKRACCNWRISFKRMPRCHFLRNSSDTFSLFWTFERVCLVDELHHTITAEFGGTFLGKKSRFGDPYATFKEPNWDWTQERSSSFTMFIKKRSSKISHSNYNGQKIACKMDSITSNKWPN